MSEKTIEYWIEPYYDSLYGRELRYKPFRNGVQMGCFAVFENAKNIINRCKEVDEYNESLKNKNESCQR